MNRLTRLTLITLAVLGNGIGSASAEWLNPERGLEIDPRAIELPPYANGTISFSACAECERLSLALTTETRYYLAPRTPPVLFDDLRSVFHASVHDARMIVYVYYDPKTMAVNRLVLDPPE